MFKLSRQLSGLHMSFSSTLDNIDQADEETKRFLDTIGLKAEAYGIRLAMREAVLNAIKHGSRLDRHKIVTYGLQLKDNYLIMEIEDEGSGFDWRSHLEKSSEPTLECGRGLAIMKIYCTDIEYNDKGNRLLLRKEIGATREILTSEIARDEGQIIVRPRKDVVASMAQEFRHELQSLVEEGTKELVIDLAGVEMVDSAGMDVLIDTHDSLSKAGGKLIVANVSKDIYGLFKTMRLDQHFTVIST